MPTVALAGWGYNGGQVIFKFQLGRDSPVNPTVYEQVAENCDCCCLPPPRVTIKLITGTIDTGVTLGSEFTPEERLEYNSKVREKLEEKLSLTIADIPCPKRRDWKYTTTFLIPGSTQPCTINLEVPRCASYPQDLILTCANGDSNGRPRLRLPLDGMPFGPTPYLDFFGFRGFDDTTGSSGHPVIGLCIENICKLYGINQRKFIIPCYVYPELGFVGTVNNGLGVGDTTLFDWNVWADDDGFEGKLAYFDVEFPEDPLP
jgi:hypothetical protein